MPILQSRKKDFTHNGVKVLRSNHKAIRRLKHIHKPSLHGFRIWPSSWLLMDYFKNSGFNRGSHILDIGCGWGIAGIYCVKNFDSIVTCMDSDSAVFPYVHLHADINDVTVNTVKLDFDDLAGKYFKNIDIMIGADICFWDNMVETLKRMINRALEYGVKNIIFADPGRPTFEKLGNYFQNEGTGNIINWDITRPYAIQGRILRVGV
ncbi:MAG: methyltransferase [Deltaproteobacteria bacterium]|nr:methyltransferase [Deltaproteobacteria bacterium]